MRLVPLVSEYTGKSVSIHASVKDATLNNRRFDLECEVSIHASVKDATQSTASLDKAYKLFQSTHL